MRISDWSSDVCSSDLLPRNPALGPHLRGLGVHRRRGRGRVAGRVPGPVAEGDAGMTMTMSASAPGAGAGSPLWLRGGYRVLFGCGALWAASVVTLWVGALDGRWTLPTAMDPLAWHQHEMLFGYLGAIIGGFVSAAMPNWTGRPTVTGWRGGAGDRQGVRWGA